MSETINKFLAALPAGTKEAVAWIKYLATEKTAKDDLATRDAFREAWLSRVTAKFLPPQNEPEA